MSWRMCTPLDRWRLLLLVSSSAYISCRELALHRLCAKDDIRSNLHCMRRVWRFLV